MKEPNSEVDALTRKVIGAAINVHRELGPGYLESVYESALCTELELQYINFANQYPVQVLYKGRFVGESHLDFFD